MKIEEHFKNLKEAYNHLNKHKIIGLLFPGYKVNTSFFMAWLLIILSLGVYIIYTDGYNPTTGRIEVFSNGVYLTCPANTKGLCENPFYKQAPCFPKDKSICEIEYLTPGQSIGTKGSWLNDYFTLIDLGLFLVALLLNHFIYNRKYDFSHLKKGLEEQK